MSDKPKLDALIKTASTTVAAYARERYGMPPSEPETRAFDEALDKDESAAKKNHIKMLLSARLFAPLDFTPYYDDEEAKRFSPRRLQQHSRAIALVPEIVRVEYTMHEKQLSGIPEEKLTKAVQNFAKKAYSAILNAKEHGNLLDIKIDGKRLAGEAFAGELEAVQNPKPFKLKPVHAARFLLEEKIREVTDLSQGR